MTHPAALAALRGLAVGCLLAACLAKLVEAAPTQSVASSPDPVGVERVTPSATPVTFRSPATPAAPGPAGPNARSEVAGALVGAGVEESEPARAVDDRAGLAAPRPQPALVDEHSLAAAHHLGHQPALDAALALLRDAQRDASLGLGAHLHALGVEEVKDVVLDPSKIASLAAPLAAELASAASALAASPSSEATQRRVSLIQAILAALQALEKPGGGGAAPLEPLQPPLPDAEQTTTQPAPLGQVTPQKKPMFSNSYLPALVQVLSHLVDEVEDREQAAAAAAAATTAAPDSEAETTTTQASDELGPATETIELTVVGSPTDSDQIVIQGPLQGIVGLLQTVTANIHGPTNPAHVVITEADKQGEPAEVVDDGAKRNDTTAAEKPATAVTADDDDEDSNNMPVVQSDVPIVNEETVPMMMMINMVPSDAPEMVMDSAANEADVVATTLMPAVGDSPKAGAVLDSQVDDEVPTYTPEEIRNFVSHPAYRRHFQTDDSSTLEDILESADFEDLKDNAFLVNGIRGEAAAVGRGHKRVPPSAPLLKLVRLRFALSAEAKRQQFKKIQGFSDAVLVDLVKTSAMTSREQLGSLLTTVLGRDEIKSVKTKANAAKVLEDLVSEDSPLSLKLKDIPALKYAP